MDLIIKALTNEKGEAIGSIVTADLNKIPTPAEKIDIEIRINHFIHDSLYYGRALHVYSNYQQDIASQLVLLDVNNLPEKRVTVEI
ncbi:MAG: hypothetical protein ABIP51_11605 [Bacteroidia bacterium]